MPLERVRRTTLVEAVISHLRGEIVAGTWPVGSRIPTETELVATLEVARTTLREAIRALAHTGMLEVRHGDGTYVRATSEFAGAVARRSRDADDDAVLDLLRTLTAEAARAAARTGGGWNHDHLTRLLDLRRSAWRDRDRVTWLAAELEFHQAIADGCGNPMLAELVAGLSRPLRPLLEREWDAFERPGAAGADPGGHDDLLAALSAGDVERAAAEAVHHLPEPAAATAAAGPSTRGPSARGTASRGPSKGPSTRAPRLPVTGRGA